MWSFIVQHKLHSPSNAPVTVFLHFGSLFISLYIHVLIWHPIEGYTEATVLSQSSTRTYQVDLSKDLQILAAPDRMGGAKHWGGDSVAVPKGISHNCIILITGIIYSIYLRNRRILNCWSRVKHLLGSDSAHSSEVAKLCKCYSNSSGGCVIKSTSTSFLGWMVERINL